MKKKWYIILGVVQMFVGIPALVYGLFFILEPDGSRVGMGIEALSRSPFNSYLIPGIILFLINGAGNIASAVLSFRRSFLTGYAGVLFGGALVIWIAVQILMIGYVPGLQLPIFVIGSVEIVLGLLIWRKNDE